MIWVRYPPNNNQFAILARYTNKFYSVMGNTTTPTVANTDGRGMYISNRNSSTNTTGYKNGTGVLDIAQTGGLPTSLLFIGVLSYNNIPLTGNYGNKECAFASIGDGLTDGEAANFYTAVQKFQTTLGRQIGSPIVSDTDAQAFINAAGLTDLGQANAVNTLVVDLKTAGVWTKMKALYPFVGGTATTHKWNLKDPRDLDAAFRLVFNGGWTHSATGALPNGTTGYADTKLTPSVNLGASSAHFSYYSRTATTSDSNNYVIGAGNGYGFTAIILRNNTKFFRHTINNSSFEDAKYDGALSTSGLFLGTQDGTNTKLFRNATIIGQNFGTDPRQDRVNIPLFIGAENVGGTSGTYTTAESSFASIGDSLTDIEVTAFNTAVQKYQTTLGRQIGTPVLAEGQTAGLLETYSGAAVAYSLRKLRNGYYGFAIRVRRSSDNAEQDIAFKSDGTLDTTSLLAFVGSGNGFVTTWYDQSGNGYNAYQSTAINQPLIVSSGSLTTNGGKPAIRCAGSTGLLINQISLGTTHSMFAVIDWSGPYKEYFGSFGNSWAFYQVDGEYKASGVVGRTNAAFTTNRFLGTLLRVNTQLQYYQNSATLGSAFTISSNNVFNLSNLIGEDYNWGFAGDQQEAIIYTSSMASSRTAIESNINSYYSIY
jgi:hypothetical protein